MEIRKAKVEDIDILMEIYARARAFMRQSGNPNQWPEGTPSKEDLLKDIENGLLHVIIDDDIIQASFVYYEADDPCYSVIYDGNWLNDKPYAVLHRVATRGLKRHMGQIMLDYAFERNDNVRIDTHEDNKPMQNMLIRNGFKHVGSIILKNGEPRWAYHWSKDCNFE